jgi:hypothetical protein
MNTVDQFFDKVYELQNNADALRGYKQSIFEHLAKVTEEHGELAENLLQLSGYKTNDEDRQAVIQNAKEEIVDLTLMGIVMGNQFGMTKEEFIEIGVKKLAKWQSKHIDPLKK